MADGTTPVPGASVFLTASQLVAFTACGGGATCTVITDQSGEVSTGLTVMAPGVTTVTAQLAPVSYKVPQEVQTTIFGITSLAISLSPTNVRIAQGASLSLPVTARVLSNGSSLRGEAVTFTIRGPGTLSSSTVTSDANGYATTILQVANLSAEVDVNACIVGMQLICPTLAALSVPLSALRLQPFSGITQVMPVGVEFAPVLVRVTDQAAPPDPVLGASVFFQSLVGRSPNNEPILWITQTGINQPTVPVILAQSQSTVISDVNGLASIQPTVEGIGGPVVVLGAASVGSGTLDFALQSLPPPVANTN